MLERKLTPVSIFIGTSLFFAVGIVLMPFRAAAEPEISAAEIGASDGSESTSETTDDSIANARSFKDRLWMNYYGIFYGSSISNISGYQTSPYREKDTSRSVLLKNFVTAGYDLNDRIAIAATGYFTYAPNATKTLAMQDPSLRVADSSILSIGGFNWYGDARVHFAVSDASRVNDLLVGFQSFHYFSYVSDGSRWVPGIYASARYNYFGKMGQGNDLDLYLAPSLNYGLSDNLALTFLYEMGASHTFGDDAGNLDNEGTDFQPGILWRITPGLEVNPYLNIYTGGKISMNTTSFGMTLSWMMF